MKKIHFDYYRSPINLLCTAMVVIGAGITLTGILMEEGTDLSKIGMILNGIGAPILFGKMFFFNPYFNWNKKGMVIKFNSFWPKSIRFEHIKSYTIDNKILSIFYQNNSETYDLQHIRQADIKKLDHLLKELI